MIDGQTAVQDAVFAALDEAAAVTVLGDVWQHPPQDTQPVTKGVVIVGPVALEASDDKTGGFDKATFVVITYVRKPDARQLYALNAEVRNALEGQALTASNADLSAPVFLSADPQLMDDGETYRDELRFELWVQAA